MGSEMCIRDRGKITLSELSYSPPRPVKVKVAQEHGAIGHVIRGWGPPEYEVISKSEAKWVWGNPTIDDMDDFPKIPALLITKKDGLYLEELTKKGKVRVRLKARVDTGWRKLIIPVTTIEGKEEPEKFILVGGHYDSWGAGVTCNAVGVALLLELARVLAKHKDGLRRSVKIAWWPGHEMIYLGSTFFNDYF